jgi:hypothetical protein
MFEECNHFTDLVFVTFNESIYEAYRTALTKPSDGVFKETFQSSHAPLIRGLVVCKTPCISGNVVLPNL